MEIVTETSRNFIKREELDFFLAVDATWNEQAFESVHQFRPDIYRAMPNMLIRVAQLTSVVEKIWGRDIQVEFVVRGSTINFVQVRELPPGSIFQAAEIEFPDEEPIHSGASIGVGDMELSVLDNQTDNSEKTGVVMFGSNYGWTMLDNTNRLPKEGAVIIWSNDGQNGHIQTLCAERGLVCLFPNANEDIRRNPPRYEEISMLNKVRVVSNGMEARVY